MSEEYDGHTDLVDAVIFENLDKGIQYRFCISEFLGKNYIGVRNWIQDYDGDYIPTKNGFTMLYELHSVSALFGAFVSVLSKAEVLNQVTKEHYETTNDKGSESVL